MKFNFPKEKSEYVNIQVLKSDIAKVRVLAELNDCTQLDIYKTLVNESLEEYEKQFGPIVKEQKKKYSVKRDYLEAGDNKRKEVIEKYPDSFNGGGDLRTNEAKNARFDKSTAPNSLAKCAQCGMVLTGEFENRRSKKVLNKCDDCGGDFKDIDDESGIYKSTSIASAI